MKNISKRSFKHKMFEAFTTQVPQRLGEKSFYRRFLVFMRYLSETSTKEACNDNTLKPLLLVNRATKNQALARSHHLLNKCQHN